jgi:hypothetical protein
MPRFIVRVELHNTEYSHPDYAKLHKAMHAVGFSKFFLDGDLWRLPHAEYYCKIEATGAQILDRGWITASKIKPNPKVLVSRALEITHRGLNKISLPAVAVRKGILAAIKPGSLVGAKRITAPIAQRVSRIPGV